MPKSDQHRNVNTPGIKATGPVGLTRDYILYVLREAGGGAGNLRASLWTRQVKRWQDRRAAALERPEDISKTVAQIFYLP